MGQTAVKQAPPPAITPAEVIAAALGSDKWTLRELTSPGGRAVRTIELSLEKMGFEIVAKEAAKP